MTEIERFDDDGIFRMPSTSHATKAGGCALIRFDSAHPHAVRISAHETDQRTRDAAAPGSAQVTSKRSYTRVERSAKRPLPTAWTRLSQR